MFITGVIYIPKLLREEAGILKQSSLIRNIISTGNNMFLPNRSLCEGKSLLVVQTLKNILISRF
jgi:hypothetical protein